MESNPERMRIAADNRGSGTQNLVDGNGDQNVNDHNGTQYNKCFFGTTVLSMPFQSPSNGFHLPRQGSWTKEPTGDAIVAWLKLRPNQPPLSCRSRQDHLRRQASLKTGLWVLEKEEVKTWRDSSSSCQHLWMYGIMGSGKTMLISLIVESIEEQSKENKDIGYAFIYFNEEDECRASFGRIWATLFMQLLEHSNTTIAPGVKKRFNSPPQGSEPFSSSEYFELFRDQADTLKTVYLVFDALDSYCKAQGEEKWQEMQDALGTLPNIKVLFTSQREWLGPDKQLGLAQRLLIEPQRDDIVRYVSGRIESDKRLQGLLKLDRSESTVAEQVTRLSLGSGMFLLAKLHMNELSNQINVADIHSALRKIPRSVISVFEAATEQIIRNDHVNDSKSRLARHVLTWILHAKTELNVDQVRGSFAVQESTNSRFKQHLPSEEWLLSVCAGLVIMDLDKRTLSLVHNSVEDHLRKLEIIPHDADLIIAKTCIRYMLITDSDGEEDGSLLQYAARYWSMHVALAGNSTDHELERLTMNLLRSSSKLTRAFNAMPDPVGCVFDNMTGLHASVYFDLKDWMERLVDAGEDVDKQCQDGQTALHWAVRYGRCEMIRLLVSRSADPNIIDRSGNAPLHKALLDPIADSSLIVQSLVEGGAKLNIKGARGLTPLSTAIQNGPTAIAEILIKHQKDVDAEITKDWNLLREVIYHGRDIVDTMERDARITGLSDTEGLAQLRETAENHGRRLLDLLLAKNVNLNRPTSSSKWTPLIHAVKNADVSKMRRFLGRDYQPANANLRGFKEGYSPLRWALHYPNSSVVQLLIEHGADVNETYSDGWSPLIEAITQKNDDIVRVLIDAGANVDTSIGGSNPLIKAAEIGNSGALWALLQKGASLDERDNSGMSALLYAIRRRDKDAIWLLLNKNASVNDQIRTVPSALNFALTDDEGSGQKTDVSVAWLLHQHGADLDAPDKRGHEMTPLHRAASGGNLEAIRFLIDHKARIDAQDNSGRTALAFAILKEETQAVRLLVKSKASLSARDKNGMTALHLAAARGFDEGLEELLRNPEALDVRDNRGYAALHHAINSRSGSKRTVEILAKAGADLEAREGNGLRPLMLAAQLGREPIVRYLMAEGANVFARHRDGWIAADYADQHGHDDVWRILGAGAFRPPRM